MKCQCIVEYGSVLQPDSRPDIEVSGTEVLIDVKACGVCHSDLHIMAGGFDLGRGEWLSLAAQGRKLPLVPGHEVAGVVAALGPDAKGVSVGDSVVVYPWQGCGECVRCLAGDEHVCDTPLCIGTQVDGGYASQVKVRDPKYLLSTQGLDPVEVAPLACSGLTAYSAIKKLGDRIFTHPIVIIGAGGLGLMGIEILKALGAKAPVVVDIDAEKRKAALKAGASAAIDPASPNVVAEIQRAVGKAPEAAVDFVGAEATTRLGFSILGKTGNLVIVGLFGGASPWQLPLIPMKSISIVGSYLGSIPEFHHLLDLFRQKKLSPIPTYTRPLDEANQLLHALEQGQVVGRGVLVP
jgi:alcohol dehydrogenase, propanol-preferring